MNRPPPRLPMHAAAASRPRPLARLQPLDERELDELQALLDLVPAPLEALDVSMVDGFLCGLLIQPQPVPLPRWLPHVTDADGRALPASFDASRLHTLVLRRHTELNDAITRRQWFDPWVFELGEADAETPGAEVDDAEDEDDLMPASADAVYPWVAGFATAIELFPALMRADAAQLTGPLALIYRHLAPDDLEDADELLAEIESLEPPADLSEAVEELVRATLLLADVGRPVSAGPAHARRPGSRRR